MPHSLEIDEEVARRLRRQDSIKRRSTLQSYTSGRLSVTSKRSVHEKVRHFVVSCPWLCVQTAMLIVDMVFLFLSTRNMLETSPQTFIAVTLVVNFLYWIDMGLRIFGFGLRNFFSKGWNYFDFSVVLVSSIGAYISIQTQLKGAGGAGIGRVARIFRVVRMVRLTTLGRRASVGLCDCMRLVTGENKRRFIDAEHDFNLDVTYITPRVISMSVPASGWLTPLYRNPLSEVVRFFEIYHQGRYLIVNCCPELPYPSDAFSGDVHCFNIQDHTPPMLEQFVNFLSLVQPWMTASRSNVMAVHCRGGKGRTGSFCCAWLLYSRKAEDAEDALALFAMQRTDIENTKVIKLQGVETPSQVRYVEYIDEMLYRQNAFCPAPVQLVPEKTVNLESLSMHRLFSKPDDMPKELVVAVHSRKLAQVVFWSDVAPNNWSLANAEISGDFRISVFDRTKLKDASKGDGKAGKEPGCLFYFMAHTHFLHDGTLTLPKAKIDKAWKKPKLYSDEGHIQLSFSVSSEVV